MSIKFSEKQMSGFSKNILDILKDKYAFILFRGFLKNISVYDDYSKALDLWNMVENLSHIEREQSRKRIEKMYDSIDEFSNQGINQNMMAMQSDCIKYLQNVHAEFICYLGNFFLENMF